MNRRWVAAVGVPFGIALVVGPAWSAHRAARRDVYWENVGAGRTTVDREGFRERGQLADPGGPPMERIVLAGLALDVPLDGMTWFSAREDPSDTRVLLNRGEKALSLSVLREDALALGGCSADMRSLLDIAAAPAPSYAWPLVPSAIGRAYVRYMLKVALLGHEREVFDNGSLRGVLGQSQLPAVTMVGEGAFVQVGAADRTQVLAVAYRARPEAQAAPSAVPRSQLAVCLECTLNGRADCETACAAVERPRR